MRSCCQMESKWREIIGYPLKNGVKVEGKFPQRRQPHISKTVSMPGTAFYIRKGTTGLKIKKRMSHVEKSNVSLFILHQRNALNDLI